MPGHLSRSACKPLWTFLAVSLAWCRPAAAVPAGSEWLTSVDEAVERAAAEKRYILVDLYAEWCGWCKNLEREVFADTAFIEYARRFVLLWVDVEDGGEGSELQARFQATSLPTTLVLDSNLVKVGEVTGFHPTRRFLGALDKEVRAYDSLLELFDRVRSSDDVTMQRRLGQDLHDRGDGRRAAELYELVLRQMPAGSRDAAWLHFQTADAYRLGAAPAEAERHLERSRKLAAELGDRAILERADLLSFQLAQDRGDCGAAQASLEHFLAHYPDSAYTRQARRTLKQIQRSEGTECT